MDQKEALLILINHSFLLSDRVKTELAAKLNEMSAKDVWNLGRFLALEKKQSLKANQKMIDSLEEALRSARAEKKPS